MSESILEPSNSEQFDQDTVLVDVLIHVHTLPPWLEAHLTDPNSEYYIWAQDYQRLIQGDNLWKVWMVAEDGGYWLEVNYMTATGEPAFNTLKLEAGTFALVETEPYRVLSE